MFTKEVDTMQTHSSVPLPAFTRYKFYPWVVISLCAFLLFYKYVLNISPSVMTDSLMRDFHIDGTQLGVLAACFFYSYTITQLFVGVILDRYGARLFGGLSVAISVLGVFLFSHATQLWEAEVARVLMGFGAAFATVTYLKMTAVWFRYNQLAFVGGLLATAVMLGAVFGQAPLAYVVEKVGWRDSMWLCGLLGLIVTLFFVLFVRDKSTSSDQSKASHEKQSYSLQDVVSVLRNPQNWLLTFYSGFAFVPVLIFGGLWGDPFLQEAYALTRIQSAQFVSLAFIGLGVGSPVLGFISDYLGKRLAIMRLGLLLSFVSVILVIYMPNLPLWLLGPLLFMFGFGAGAFMLVFAVGRQINKLSLIATVIALINTGEPLLDTFSDPLVGKILDWTWHGEMVNGVRHFTLDNYHVAFALLPLYLCLGFLLLLFIREPAVTEQVS